MHPAVQVVYDRKRKCGWRKNQGIYLVSNEQSVPCGKLPLPLTTCPTCSHGIKPSRSWTWINIDELTKGIECPIAAFSPSGDCYCPLNTQLGRIGLLFIGEKFYHSPKEYNDEANDQGISRRIKFVPRDFKLGMWVALAHRKAIVKKMVGENGTVKEVYTSAIFRVFKSSRIEYVLNGNETDEEIDALVERGLTPMIVKRVIENPLPLETL